MTFSDYFYHRSYIRLHNRLFCTSPLAMSPPQVSESSFDDQDSSILSQIPEFSQLERSGVIPESTTRPLALLVASPDTQTIRENFSENPAVMDAVVQCLRRGTADAAVNPFLVCYLLDAVRKDSVLWGVFTASLSDALDACLSRGSSSFLYEKTACLLAGIFSHSSVSASKVQVLLSRIKEKDSPKLTLEVVSQLVRQPGLRPVLWQDASVRQTVKDAWNKSSNENILYRTAFILWVLSMDGEVFSQVCSSVQVVQGIAAAVKEAKAERIVRLIVALVKNCMQVSTLAAQIVDMQIAANLASLEYEKWKDPELYNEIREVIGKIEFSTFAHSNVARYEAELDSGRLAWSHIHSEKFWQENSKTFESKDFGLIKRLVGLLETAADPTTLAVACFDIGEFARVHPLGKKLLGRFEAKAHVMNLMSHSNREVAREALLCTQKLMLNNWQQISA